MCVWLYIKIGRSEEDDIVEALAAFSPFTPDDTKKGLQSKLKQLHGDTEGAAENLTWKQRTRYFVALILSYVLIECYAELTLNQRRRY